MCFILLHYKIYTLYKICQPCVISLREYGLSSDYTGSSKNPANETGLSIQEQANS